MTVIPRGLMVGVMLFCLAGLPDSVQAETSSQECSQEIMTLLKEQNSRLSGELRRIQREIAALRADLDKPDIKDVVAGIGYIFGLFGVAAFVAARRKE